jgi:hypothetical protein
MTVTRRGRLMTSTSAHAMDRHPPAGRRDGAQARACASCCWQNRPPSWRLSNVPLPRPHLLAIAASAWLSRMRPWVLPGSRLTHRLAGYPLIAARTILVMRSLEAAGRVDLDHPDCLA